MPSIPIMDNTIQTNLTFSHRFKKRLKKLHPKLRKICRFLFLSIEGVLPKAPIDPNKLEIYYRFYHIIITHYTYSYI